ncbi:glycosyltransferase family 2 protein [Demequina silvatica]|uniref:glycosyltransferase family 2 protein n=1 Tax=Demequina silvatica TaxID=1638988 RepID=UPI0007838583|nr:glycosyltransferase family 2 protein [Demequina silvatica]
MAQPRITVILPVKDGEGYVGTTLKSLLRQVREPGDLKVVAISDGSTDGTAEVIRHFDGAFSHLEVIENPTAVGLASARNMGLEHAEGDYVAFIDGDDWMEPWRLQTLIDAADRLDVDFIRTDHTTVAAGARSHVRAPFPWRGRAVSPREAILPARETTMVDYPYAWAGLFHRRLHDRGMLAFPEGLFTAEDRPWIWNLHLNAESFAVVDAPSLLYRREVSTSLTQIFDSRQLDFIRSFDMTRQVVEADPEADRFMAKLTATTLAVSAHHLRRRRRMSTEDRERLKAGVADLIAALPQDVVRDALHRGPGRRRLTLARYTRTARTRSAS